MSRKLKILGIDPGTTFSGYAVISTTIDKDKVKSVSWSCSGLFRNLVKSLDSTTHQSAKPFMKEVRYVLNKYKPDVIVMESFMQRSFRSNLASPISLMIGIVLHMAHRRGIKFITVMPNDWQRRLKRDFKPVDEIYDMSYPIKQRLPNHNVDSFFQALFACGEPCYKNLKETQVETIKRKMKAFGGLQADIDYVNNLEKERLLLLREKKARKKSRKKKK